MVVSGLPEVQEAPGLSVAERRELFARQFIEVGAALCNEPRAPAAAVGALLVPSQVEGAVAGVIFFNNVGVLQGCIHGTLGVVRSLAFLGRIGPGEHCLETPVGVVTARLGADGRISVANVPSYRFAHHVAVEVPGQGTVVGDIAWGGNWFFLVDVGDEPLELDQAPALTARTAAIAVALRASGITGEAGATIDHVELFSSRAPAGADSQNFVLCPGLEYDRSPCGTGTSAKLACLVAEGRLGPGQVWRQAGIVGSIFEGRSIEQGGTWVPEITGTAWVTGEATVRLDPDDPFCFGLAAKAAKGPR